MPLSSIVRGTVTTVESACIDAALRLTSGNVAAAAQVLGLDEHALRARLLALGMQPASGAADRGSRARDQAVLDDTAVE